GPNVNLADRAEHAGADQGGRPPQAVAGRALVAHLRGDLVLAGELRQAASLPDGVGQRLLGEAVLAPLHGHARNDGVGVVRRAHRDRLDGVAQLVEHAAEVVVALRPGVELAALGQGVVVDVAQGDDVAVPGGVGRVADAFAADADAGK